MLEKRAYAVISRGERFMSWGSVDVGGMYFFMVIQSCVELCLRDNVAK